MPLISVQVPPRDVRTDLRARAVQALAGLSLLFAGSVAALDYQVHGFASQGYVRSRSNDILGNSSEGSWRFYEAGVNGAADLGHGLMMSAQLLARRAGDVDDGDLRLDYGLLDWQAVHHDSASGGIRFGRVKNVYGLFNDTRDTVFSRPGILLPDSVYGELSGQQRAVLFSSDGGQLYGDLVLGTHDLSLTASVGRKRGLDDEEKRLFIDLGGAPFGLDLDEFRIARLMDDIGQGRWQIALSSLHGRFNLASPDIGLDGHINIESYVLSLRYNAERWSLFTEYAPQRTSQMLSVGADSTKQAYWTDGGYVQADYRVQPQLTLHARIDAAFDDRSKRDGSGCADWTPPRQNYECYSRDYMAGASWLPDLHWGLWAELHLIDGTFEKYAQIENTSGTPAQHWGALLLMAAYRF